MPVISRSLRKVAKNRKTPILVFEGGEALRLDGLKINHVLLGLERMLVAQKLSDNQFSLAKSGVSIEKASRKRTSVSRILTWNQNSGAFIY